MGGEQAAQTLLTVKRDQLAARGESMTAEEEQQLVAPVLAIYEAESSAYYSTARVWDDGILDPAETRDVLGLVAGDLARSADPRAARRRLPDVIRAGC